MIVAVRVSPYSPISPVENGIAAISRRTSRLPQSSSAAVALHVAEERVVLDPEEADHEEAEHEGEDVRAELADRLADVRLGHGGDVDPEDQQGDRDREDAVAERLDPGDAATLGRPSGSARPRVRRRR